jgi:hypothetical protein
VRDRETIDADLQVLREMRQLIRDRLLDERGESPVDLM